MHLCDLLPTWAEFRKKNHSQRARTRVLRNQVIGYGDGSLPRLRWRTHRLGLSWAQSSSRVQHVMVCVCVGHFSVPVIQDSGGWSVVPAPASDRGAGLGSGVTKQPEVENQSQLGSSLVIWY